MELSCKLDLAKIVKMPNIADELCEEDLATIGRQVAEDFLTDVASRQPWDEKMQAALKLALQVKEIKTFPWQDAANVKFPLTTIAALQFHARAYPGLITGPDIVKCRTYGDDPTGESGARARRVADHMSYQVLEEDEDWENSHDRVLITLPILGCAFKKVYYDPTLGHNVSEYIPAYDVYLPYYARRVETAERWTHVLHWEANKILGLERQGIFRPQSEDSPKSLALLSRLEELRDLTQGVERPIHDTSAPDDLLEQHRYLDLDGDGYEEPYVVTIRKDTQHVCRIVARFFMSDIERNRAGEIFNIRPTCYLQKYPFIPSPDGGIYDLGFGQLLGSVNESIDSVVNQLLDAGTLANLGGGFLGRGAKFRSGDSTFTPGEWKRVDFTGDDLRRNVVPLMAPTPSPVLFQLLSLLIDYGERISGATEAQVGVNPGQNTPAETSRNVLMEGQKIFLGIFKRVYRAQKEEFRKLYRLNQRHLDDTVLYYGETASTGKLAMRRDYDPSDKSICPAADPDMVNDQQKILQVQLLKQASQSSAGYDLDEVERRFLRTLRVPDVDIVFPGSEKKPPSPNYKIQLEQMRSETKLQEAKMQMQLKAMELLSQVDLLRAQVEELQASKVLKLAQAKGVESGQAVALISAQIGAAKAHQDHLLKAAKLIMDGIGKEQENGSRNTAAGGGEPSSAYGGGVPGLAAASHNKVLQGLAASTGAGG